MAGGVAGALQQTPWQTPVVCGHGVCWRLHGVCWRLHGRCLRLHGRCFAHARCDGRSLWGGPGVARLLLLL